MTDQTPAPGAGSPPPPPPPPPPSTAGTYPPPPEGAPKKKSRRGLAITAGVVGLLVVAIAVTAFVGRGSAASTAEDYEAAVDSFEKRGVQDMIDAAATFPDSLFPSGDGWADDNLAAQRESCEAVEGALDDLDAIDVPELDDHVFGFLSGTYKDARDGAEKWSATMTDFRDAARDHLSSMIADCSFQIAYNEALADYSDIWDAIQKHTDKKGEETVVGNTRWTCDSDEGCLPANQEKLDRYVKEYAQYQDQALAIADLAASKQCTNSALGKEGCAALGAAYSDAHEARSRWINAVEDGGSTPTGEAAKRRDEAYDVMNKSWDESWKQVSKVLLKMYPKMADEDWVDPENIWHTQVYWFAADQRYHTLEESAPEVG